MEEIKLQIIEELKNDFNTLEELAEYYFNGIYGNEFIDKNKLLINIYNDIKQSDIDEIYNEIKNNDKCMIIGIEGK